MEKAARWLVLLPLVLSLCACGMPEEETTAPETRPRAAQTLPAETETVCSETKAPALPELTDGCWVCTGLEIDGNTFAEEEMLDLIGLSSYEIMTVRFYGEHQMATMALFGTGLFGPYTETEGGWKINPGIGEEMTAVMNLDGTMTVTITEIYFEDDREMESSLVLTLKNSPGYSPDVKGIALANYLPWFDMEQTYAMGSFSDGGWYIVYDDVLYGLSHLKTGKECLGRTSLLENGCPGETEILQTGLCTYFCSDGTYLYYIMDGSVYRLDPSDSQIKVLCADVFAYLQYHNGRLYFTNLDNRLESVDLSGGDRQMELDEAVFFPYFLDDEWMVYQDDANNERLCIMYMPTGESVILFEESAYTPILKGHELYFLTSAERGGYHLCKADLWTFGVEVSEKVISGELLFLDEETLATSNYNTVSYQNWQQLSSDAYRSGYFLRYAYADPDYLVLLNYDEQEQLIYEKDIHFKKDNSYWLFP